MVLGLFVFVLPNVKKINDVFLYGTLFGIIVYGVYDFTCAAIFEDFDKKLMIYDILWGGALYTITSLFYLFIKKNLVKQKAN